MRNFRPSTYLHISTAYSRKANVSDQRIPRILWNPIFHKPLPVRIPSRMNPVYIIPPQFLNTYFNIIFQTMATLSPPFNHLSSDIRPSHSSHISRYFFILMFDDEYKLSSVSLCSLFHSALIPPPLSLNLLLRTLFLNTPSLFFL